MKAIEVPFNSCLTRFSSIPVLFIFTLLLALARLSAAEVLAEAQDIQRVPIVSGLANAVDFEIAPDGRIFILNRFGGITLYDPVSQTTTEALRFDVYSGIEAGLNGLALDPNFSTNAYLYLFYSPLTPNVNRVSRFTLVGNKVNLASEVVILDIPVDRLGGNHDGGNLEFDAQGNLYIGTGDDTYHSSYSPLNESSVARSAEKSASNSQDLRGKILRIHPNANGTYSIPTGNLFSNAADGRREIYIMGARNPYKFHIDEVTQQLIWADIGPDANTDSSKGPSGKDEINISSSAGNYGWPYFVGANLAYYNTYNNYYFDPAKPTNDSKWNTGLKILPPAKPAWLSKQRSSYMVGSIYHYDSSINNPTKLPPAFDNHLFYWDFNNSKVWYVALDANNNILNEQEWTTLSGLGQGYIDFEIGPDGHLYILEYGTGCCDFDVGNGILSRIDYTGASANLSPVVKLSSDKRYGDLPLTVNFSAAGSFDPDGDSITLEWDFDGDGVTDADTQTAAYTYYNKGNFNALLKVTDSLGAVATAGTTIRAGNNVADITFEWPPEGGFYDWNERIDVQVNIVDKEDGSISQGSINCNTVTVIPSLGHLEHAHDTPSFSRCDPTITAKPDEHEPDGEDDLYYRLQAGYRDQDGLDSYKVINLYPKRSPAAFANQRQGTVLINNTDSTYHAVNAVRITDAGAFLKLSQRNLTGITGIRYRLASSKSGQTIELRSNSKTGPIVSSVSVPASGGAGNWVDVEDSFAAPTTTVDLYLVFPNYSSTGSETLDLVSIEFLGEGISYPAPTNSGGDSNLALAQPTNATSVENDDLSLAPANATDGDLTTRWASVFRHDPQWLVVDLGQTRDVHQVILHWETAYAKAYQIQVSMDGNNWQTVFTENASNGDVDTLDFSTVAARFVRMYGTQRATKWGYSLWEMEVIGSEHESPVLSGLSLSPANSTVEVGQSIGFQVQGVDQWGAAIPAAVNWTVSGGGYIDNTGKLTTTAAGGPFLVTAVATTDSTIRATAQFMVTAPSNSGTDNFALKKPAAASSFESGDSANFAADYAFDGDLSTRWASEFKVDPQWLSVDLQSERPINKITLNWEAAYAKAYQIQISQDGKNWSTVFTEANSNGAVDVINIATVSTRYVRLLGTQRATRWGYSLWEMSVTGPQVITNQNLVIGKVATASTVENTSLSASAAIDQDSNSRWASVFSSDPQWLQVDLGQFMLFNEVRLDWERASAREYQIQVSSDGITWTSLYQEVAGDGGLDKVSFANTMARYVRVYCTKRSTKYGYSLWEFGVYLITK